MNRKIFITGGAGFIGYHLAQSLNYRGDEVLCYDNFNNYYSINLKEARASQLRKNNIHIIKGDICDFPYLCEQIENFKPTHIINLAAQAGVRDSITNPSAYIKDNIGGFFNVLEVCKRHPNIKLIYASSASVYGDNKKVPFSTNDVSDSPSNLYGATKKSNELMAYSYHSLYKISVTGLRFFTVYGPWGRPDMAYYSFATAIVQGKTIDIYNKGHMWRDFTYIDDIVQGIIQSIDLNNTCDVFNLGTHRKESLSNFVSLIEKSLGIQAKKNYPPMQLGDMLSTYSDNSESTARLGFKPHVSLEEGLPKFIHWFKSYHNDLFKP